MDTTTLPDSFSSNSPSKLPNKPPINKKKRIAMGSHSERKVKGPHIQVGLAKNFAPTRPKMQKKMSAASSFHPPMYKDSYFCPSSPESDRSGKNIPSVNDFDFANHIRSNSLYDHPLPKDSTSSHGIFIPVCKKHGRPSNILCSFSSNH